MGCGECFYEGFFSCPIDANDRAFLRDYGQVLVEKCNFTYVAVTREQQVVGFISGKYSKGFSKRWRAVAIPRGTTGRGLECS